MHKILRSFALLGAWLIVSACGGGNGSEDVTTDDGTEPDVPVDCVGCGDPYEATFIITSLHIGTVDQGFNLDDEYTQCTDGSCKVDGNNGVDNRLSEILAAVENAMGEPLNADSEIDRNITEGDMLVLLRFLDVELANMASMTSSDPDIEVKGYMGLDTDEPEDPLDNLSGSEPFNVDDRSLRTVTDIESSLIDFTKCRIVSAKLRCEPSLFSMDITIQDAPLHLEIRESQLECTVETGPTDDGTGNYVEGSLRNCILGGFVPISALQDALDEFAGSLGDIQPEQIQQILVNHADIDAVPEGTTGVACPVGDECLAWQTCQAGTCYEPMDQFDSVSLGVVIQATSAVFTGEIVHVEETP
jgi:hypothetical protein